MRIKGRFVRVEDVQDFKALGEYLDTLPVDERPQCAALVSFRSAGRVLPILAESLLPLQKDKERELLLITSLGCLAIAGVSSERPCNKICIAAGLASGLFYKIASTRSNTVEPFDLIDGPSISGGVADAIDAVLDATNVAENIAHSAIYTTVTTAKASNAAARFEMDIWDAIRGDLKNKKADRMPLWSDGGSPANALALWERTKKKMLSEKSANWSFWIAWYERLLDGRDLHVHAIGEVLTQVTNDDWTKGPAHINPMFDDVLALYRAEDAAFGGAADRDDTILHVKTVRTQVAALQDFLDVEYRKLSGHNARDPIQDELLELLADLQALVAEMMACFNAADDDGQAIVTIRENLPAVIEKTGALAIVEPDPEISPTLAAMAVTVKTLVDAGADPTIVTKYALGEAAGNKLLPKFRAFFSWRKEDCPPPSS